MLFEAGRNFKQVAYWLGSADPSFTLRTYVHLMDAEVGDAEFLDAAVASKSGKRARPLSDGVASSACGFASPPIATWMR
jgi:hypothetical protein